MGTATGVFSARPGHRIRLETQLAGQNIEGNYSVVNWQLYIERTQSSQSYKNDQTGGGSVGVGPGSYGIGGFAYDFRSTAVYTLGTGSTAIGHNADGTGSYGFSASINAAGTLGQTSASGSEGLPTIPRATTPTVSPGSGQFGQSFTIGHSGASGSFVHDVFYSLNGGQSYAAPIVSNSTAASTTWTPTADLLPNSGSVTAIILLRTRQGANGTIIGDKTIALPLTVPDSVKPTIQTVTWADAQTSAPDIATLMGGSGRFVQRWSRLIPTVTSVGASGSTVTASNVTMTGQTTPSGTAFGLPVSLSGNVPYSATVTDTRSRSSDPYANTVAVTAYNFPNLPVPLVARTTDAAGTIPSPLGTYLAITPAASVSSLLFGGSEKNLLEWRVRTKPVGGSYTTKQDWTSATVSGNTWTTKYIAGGGYSSSTEYVVEVSIRDVFGKNGYSTAQTVSTLEIPVRSENVFMDWDGNNGIGIGKFRTAGMLDVEGQIYQNHGLKVIDESSLAASLAITGIVSPIWSSGLPSVQVTSGPNLGTTVTAMVDRFSPEPGDSVLMERTPSGTYYITGSGMASRPRFMKQIPITLNAPWMLYSDLLSSDAIQDFGVPDFLGGYTAAGTANGLTGKAYATMTSTGIVSVAGLIRAGSAPASGSVIAVLPLGIRPARTQLYRGYSAGGQASMSVEPNGQIIYLGAQGADTGFFGLDNIRFRASGYGTFVPLTLKNSWAQVTTAIYSGESGSLDHAAGYTYDSEGVVLMEGVVRATAAMPTNVDIAQAGGLVSTQLGSHQLCWSSGGLSQQYIRFASSGDANPPAGVNNFINAGGGARAVGDLVALSQMLVLNTSAPGALQWGSALGNNNWIAYDTASWASPSVTRTVDGLVLLRGLWKGGTFGTDMQHLTAGYMPRNRSVIATVANEAMARLDIGPSYAGLRRRTTMPTTGSNVWFSTDGISWPAYA